MPELPDITIYVERLEDRLVGQTPEGVRLLNPFVLRSVTPPIAAAEGTTNDRNDLLPDRAPN